MPIQALYARGDLSKHPSWSPKWFRSEEGQAYRALTRDDQRDQLLEFLASQVAARGGKKKRGRGAPDADVSGTDAESIPDEYTGFDLTTKVALTEVEHIDLVAGGATLSRQR